MLKFNNLLMETNVVAYHFKKLMPKFLDWAKIAIAQKYYLKTSRKAFCLRSKPRILVKTPI